MFALYLSSGRPRTPVTTYDYTIPSVFGGNSIGLYNLSPSMLPHDALCVVSPLESKLDLGRRRRLVGCGDDGRARRERGRHMERIALAQAERAQAGRQRRWAARGRGSRRGCGRRLHARVELRPTWALAVRFCKRKK